ncbi:MAG: DNA-binding protein [Armatimonadota bacterium]
MNDKLTVSVVEAGRMLGVGRCTAFRLAKAGTIPTLRLGKKLRVSVPALNAMLMKAGIPAGIGGDSNA